MPEQSVQPHVRLVQMATACFLSRLVWAAANLRIADHLASGPKSADELSAPTGCNARPLHRFLRALTNFGILTLGEDARFALTPLGEALKSDAPGFARSTILSMAGQWSWRAWEEFQYTVETGKPAMERVFGMPLFEFLAQHPDEAARFSESMASVHEAEPAAVAEAYDFSPLGVIVDVGGATGNLLAHILARYPARGVLFDRPHVASQAPALLRSRGVEGRVAIEPGSFFESVPAGGDAYILSHVIHDWDEEQCLTILGHCRRAMKPASKLLLIELVLREGNAPGFGSSDMVMMLLTGGEERTAQEYGALLARAGLRMTRVVPTASNASIVEAERA
ncbi:MAG TPA: methyltransferase [Patescibacteria group bacterium]|nr:methyltransferase [Patescibacteria group bacterium]